jgi:hypothetical protein
MTLSFTTPHRFSSALSGHPMDDKIISNRIIKSLTFLVLIILLVFSGHGAFSQKVGESKVILFVT